MNSLTRRLAGLALLLLACGKDSTAPPPPPPAAVASVAVAPTTSTLTVGDTVRLVASVKDASGNVLTDRVVTWVSGNPAVATVSGTGLVTGVRADAQEITITATSETVSGSAGITVSAPVPTVSFATIEAGGYHTCGRTTAGAAYCWGDNGAAQLGIGALSPASATTPQAVNGGLAFASISVGGIHACGLTGGRAAYCWGADLYGGLGAGAPGPETCSSSQFPCSSAPLPVAGGLTFSLLSAAWGPTCALTATGTAYCWGDNSNGELGIGADTGSVQTCSVGPCSYTPLAVAGGLAFTTLGASNYHACGLTTSGAAYCWGDNATGELGIGVTAAPDSCAPGPCSRTPVAVAGGLTFTALNVGTQHTCGRATDGRWYCWGLNNYGQLGTGATGPESCASGVPCSSTPVAVSTGLNLTAVFAGRRHSCGVTSAGAAYCWGENVDGQLGDGTTTNSLTPVAVAGGLRFASLSPYLIHTCGLTTGGVAFCWGSNSKGQLGDGTSTGSTVPVRVAGQPGAAAALTRR
jgi:alpha-tubulin suppressor-like RCC1 family protein